MLTATIIPVTDKVESVIKRKNVSRINKMLKSATMNATW